MLSRLLRGGPFVENGAQFMLSAAREYGDLVAYTTFGRTVFQLNHPDLIADVFLKDSVHHHRNLVMQKGREVLGHGLLTSEEPLHMRQRRLAQPAFLRDRIAAYGSVIGAKTVEMTSRWLPGPADLHPEMLELALRIVGKCLFDLDELDDVNRVALAVDSFMSFLPLSFLPFSSTIQRLPIPAMRRLRRSKLFLDELIYTMIAARRADGRDRGDLLSMLLNATDDGAVMSDTQLHDECVTIILAGHETTANALSFALDLLGRHPAIQQRLAQESRDVLGSSIPSAEHYPRLPFATAVFAEAMRLYPPVWVTARTCAQEYEIAGFRIPVGASILAPQFAVHRDPRFWPDPERFDPERFTPEAKAARPRYSYFPFAGGSRQCIAEGLAWMEGTLALAAILRDWTLHVPATTPPLKLKPAVSLRPAAGVKVTLERRNPHDPTRN
jgi:cytochrome P450